MESLHLSVSRAISEGVFKGIQLHGEWSDADLVSLVQARLLASKGFDFVSHCKKRAGDENKEVSVASKLGSSSIDSSFRRPVWDGIEHQQWSDLSSLLESVILSPSKDRWFCDLNREGAFRVKDARSIIDDIFLPSSEVATRWVKYIPIKINIFMWRAWLDRIPTWCNIASRGVVLESSLCPLCGLAPEDASHVDMCLNTHIFDP
nr:RNA-directed DNA polymerase, eukaryota [Tanacetum cinerariifolium]